MKYKKYSIFASILVIVLLLQFIWADTNGIWHLASDVRPGIFGENEADTTTPYVFVNPVNYSGQEIDARYIQAAGDSMSGILRIGGQNIEERYVHTDGDDMTGSYRIFGNLNVSGDIRANRFIYITSDERLKTNVRQIDNAIENVKNIEGVKFDWKEDGVNDIGFIAQDLEKVYPELVSTSPETGYKSVRYMNVVAILVEAIKEQQDEIEVLKKEVEVLKNE